MTEIEKIMENLAKNVRKLRGNREKVGRDVLRTRYKVAYDALLGEIKVDAEAMARHILFENLPILDDIESNAFRRFLSESNRIITEEAVVMKDYSYSIFTRYDVDGAALLLMEKLEPRIRLEAYGLTYWLAHCSEREGRYYNDLIDSWWRPEHGYWERRVNGWIQVSHLPPPTETLIRLEAWKYGRRTVSAGTLH